MDNRVEYTISLKDLFSGGMKKAEAEATHFERRMESSVNSIKRLANAGALIYGLRSAFSFLSGLVNDFDKAEQATAQLNATLKSTNNIAGVTAGELNKQAEALSLISRYDDDAITGAQSLLLTFTNIRGEILQNTTPAILDLASKMGGDLNSATIQIGKALNDPIHGITALTRVGVSFTEKQKAVIESLVKTGQTAKAQTLILEELNREFGGSAKAAAEAGNGPLVVLKNELDNIKESVGGLIADGLRAIMPYLRQFVAWLKTAVEWMKEHPTLMKAIAIGLGVVAAAFTLVSIATWAWNTALYANPIVWIIIAIAALAAGLYLAYQKCEAVRNIFNAIGEVFKVVWKIIKMIIDMLVAFGKAIYDLLDAIGVIDVMKTAFEGLGKVFGWLYTNFFKPIGDAFDKLTHKIKVANMTMKLWLGTDMSFTEAANLAERGANAEEYLAKLREQQADKATTADFMGDAGTPGLNTPIGGGGKGTSLPASEVSGKTPTTININIGSLIEKFETHTQNFTQSTQEASEQLSKALIGVVNDANRIQ